MRPAAVLAVLSVVAIHTPAQVEALEDLTVQTLLQRCEGTNLYENNYCLGLVSGISALLGATCSMVQAGNFPPTALVAKTEGATYGAAQQAFINWAKANPDKWSYPAYLGVVGAIKSTFPCDDPQ